MNYWNRCKSQNRHNSNRGQEREESLAGKRPGSIVTSVLEMPLRQNSKREKQAEALASVTCKNGRGGWEHHLRPFPS
jgi:hypothetical protein